MSQIRLNESNSLNYFIHGQELTVDFSFDQAWFVMIKYNEVPNELKFKSKPFWFWKKWFWFKKNGIFKSRINYFHPWIKIIVWQPFPRWINISLEVNKINIIKNYLKTKQTYFKSEKLNYRSNFNPLKKIHLSEFSTDYNSKIKRILIPKIELNFKNNN
jgi:hypothetical protein